MGQINLFACVTIPPVDFAPPKCNLPGIPTGIENMAGGGRGWQGVGVGMPLQNLMGGLSQYMGGAWGA